MSYFRRFKSRHVLKFILVLIWVQAGVLFLSRKTTTSSSGSDISSSNDESITAQEDATGLEVSNDLSARSLLKKTRWDTND